MFTIPRTVVSLSVVAISTLSGCGALTKEEAKDALEEVKVASQSQALTSNSVEITTHFTIGDAAEAAAGEVKSFVESQLPCAEVSVERNTSSGNNTTVVIEYGAKAGNCTYRGQKFSGTHTVSIAKNEADLVEVDHVWDNLSNGQVMLNGTASVDWDFENKSRHVVHSAEWTRLSDGRTGEGSGDRIQRALEGGIIEGFSVDGSRTWKGKKGDWSLDIDNVEMRWVDPIPQAGKYTLDTPFDKQLSLSFERASSTAIQVSIAGPRRSFDFKVLTLPDGGEQTVDMGDSAMSDSATMGDAGAP